MDAVSAATMKQEIKEMSLMLKGIREGAIELIKSSSVRSSQARRLTAEQKREKSTSSWARSTSDRSRRLVTDIVPTPDNDLHADVAKSERVLSKRAASYTFGRRCPEVQKKVSEDVTYDIKIECSSVRARAKSCVFNKAARLASPKLADPIHAKITRDVPTVIVGETVCKNNYENSSKPPKSSVISRPSKAYSFQKSAREPASQIKAVDVSGDVEGAEKKLHPHIMGVVMRPPSLTSRIMKEIPLMQDSAINFFGTSDIIAYLDALSSKGSTPTYTINKDSIRSLGGIFNKRKGNPGPGEYNPDITSYSGAHLFLVSFTNYLLLCFCCPIICSTSNQHQMEALTLKIDE